MLYSGAFELHLKGRQGANFHVPQPSRSPVRRSRGAILFLCVSLAQSGQGPPFSATWILHNLMFGDGRTWFYFVFGLGKLTFRSGPAPDVGLKKPWVEPCRSRPLRRAGIPNDHAAKRNRRQNSGGNRGPGEAGSRHSGRWHGISEERNLFWKSNRVRGETSTEPSRLAIRMDSVQWKDGSAVVKIYLTAWYYPTTVATGQDLQIRAAAVSGQDLEWRGAYPDPNSPVVKPFPGGDSSKSSDGVPNTTAAVTLHRRFPMKM
jgi:hypothetical protein